MADEEHLSDPDCATDYFEAYSHYSHLLRTWFIAYGIGGPVLFLTNDSLWKVASASEFAPRIGVFFVAGVAAQVFLAALNKATMYLMYFGEADPSFQKKKRYKVADWLAEQFWIDLSIDVLTVVLFAIATWRLFALLGNAG